MLSFFTFLLNVIAGIISGLIVAYIVRKGPKND